MLIGENKMLNGCYLAKIIPVENDPFSEDYEHLNDDNLVFIYISDNEVLEYRTADDEALDLNVRYDENGNKIFDIENYDKIDCSRLVFPNEEKTLKRYSEFQFLFDIPETQDLFKNHSTIDENYEQFTIAQHCRWHYQDGVSSMINECSKEIQDFRNGGSKYAGYDPNFKMPTPEDIEALKKKLNIA